MTEKKKKKMKPGTQRFEKKKKKGNKAFILMG